MKSSKTLFKTKRGEFKVEWHPNILLFGFVVDTEEVVIAIAQLAFIFDKSKPKKKTPSKF